MSVRILIEPSGYALLNMGDVSMLQEAVQRIKQILPDAQFHVITTDPERLRRLCPGCSPVDAREIATWRYLKVLPFTHRLVGGTAKEKLRAWDEKIRFHFPRFARHLMRANARASRHGIPGVDELWNQVSQSDVVIATGGGYFTDSFLFSANGILETFRLAQQHAKPFAIFGHGLGPLTDKHLRKKFSKVMQGASLIGLREARKGLEFLGELGINGSRVIVTGDDAIGMAVRENSTTGVALGFNIRMTNYSGVSAAEGEALGATMKILAEELNAPIIPIPIETKPEDSDLAAIQKIVPASLLQSPLVSPEQPCDVIREISKCRVVITGSYHAGVFALAQGIPIVALINSEYYADKFLGLQAQFETGVSIIYLNQPELNARLKTAVQQLWRNAESFRAPLLASAKKQLAEGQRAYEEFFARFK